jgi:branched-chain amino acid transport system ATP-binding protein
MGLAPVVVEEIISALVELRARGSSVLLVEQYVERALAVADYVYVLYRGRVALRGTPDEIQKSNLFDAYLGGASGHEPDSVP